MAERLKDDADKRLESLFRSEPVEDSGFSINVMKNVRRRIWVQRLSLPVAIAIGLAIAAKPILQLVGAIPNLMTVVPASLGSSAGVQGLFPGVSTASLPPMSTVIVGMALLGAVLMAMQMLEE
jgi:hypothetical protein